MIADYFSNVIDKYDYGRTDYPKIMYDEIVRISKLIAGDRILEIGAGPGEVTEHFKKYDIDVLEITEKQSQFLKNRFKDYSGVNVVCSSFEDYRKNFTYKLILSGTAFHWVNQMIGYKKAADYLAEGGVLALFWNVTSIKNAVTEELYGVLRKNKGGYETKSVQKIYEDAMCYYDRVHATGCFEDTKIVFYERKEEYNASRFIALVESWGISHEVPAETKKELQDVFEKKPRAAIYLPIITYLIVARKRQKSGNIERVKISKKDVL